MVLNFGQFPPFFLTQIRANYFKLMQHSLGRQAATPKKSIFKIQVIYFTALDDFVT